MVEPRISPVNESLRSSDLCDEEQEYKQDGVHDDRPAMGTAELKELRGREGRGGWKTSRKRKGRLLPFFPLCGGR